MNSQILNQCDNIAKAFGKDRFDNVSFNDFSELKIKYYIERAVEKTKIIDQLSAKIDNLLEALSDFCDGPVLTCYDGTIYEHIKFESFEDWYYKFLPNLQESANTYINQDISMIVTQAQYKYAHIYSFKEHEFLDKFANKTCNIIRAKNVPYVDAITGYDEKNTKEERRNIPLGDYDFNTYTFIYLAQFLFCSNDESLKLADFYIEQAEKIGVEYLNQRDENYRILRDQDDEGGLYNWDSTIGNKYYNFNWIKERQISSENFDKNLLKNSKVTPFSIKFTNVDRKHSLLVKGSAKIINKNNNIEATIKTSDFEAYIIDSNGTINIEDSNKFTFLRTNIIKKLKELFIEKYKQS